MRVTFTKTGQHCYGVLVERERWPDVGVNPGVSDTRQGV